MNPYLVVGSPNYAAPLLNFSALSGKQSNQQQQNQQKQQQNPYQAAGAALGNWARGLFAQPQQPGGQPLNITPGTTQGASAMLAGIY